MNKILTLALLAMFACGPAFAADEKAAPKANSQQTKMSACQAQATEKKLESTARQEFVNNCLKAKPVAEEPKSNSQQTKMATCQAQATEKKLESKARQDFVNNCLKANPVAEEPKSKMAMCNEKTKGMTKADADKTRSECMKG